MKQARKQYNIRSFAIWSEEQTKYQLRKFEKKTSSKMVIKEVSLGNTRTEQNVFRYRRHCQSPWSLPHSYMVNNNHNEGMFVRTQNSFSTVRRAHTDSDFSWRINYRSLPKTEIQKLLQKCPHEMSENNTLGYSDYILPNSDNICIRLLTMEQYGPHFLRETYDLLFWQIIST